MSGLDGKVALVTGASSGVGRAIALELARRGAAVLCSDLNRDARKEGYDNEAQTSTDALIVMRGGQALFQTADVSKAADVESAVSAAADTFGRLDIMVNNAGIFTGLATVAEQSEADFDLTMAVNVKGVFLGCKYAVRQMMRQGVRDDAPRGRIVNIASVAGQSGLHLEPAYCASKGAVLALTRQIAVDFGPHRIGINAVMPGVIQTAMTRPALDDDQVVASIRQANSYPRFGEGQDVASLTAFLASDQAEYINGAAVPVDGGFLAF